MIRPRPARWFEILAPRNDATLALEALARTGAVELETRPAAALPEASDEIRSLLQQFDALSLRYRDYWPSGPRLASTYPEPSTTTLERCLAQVRSWAREAEPLIRQLQRNDAERTELLLWRQVLAAMVPTSIDLSHAAAAGPTLGVRLITFPRDGGAMPPDALLVRRVETQDALRALVVGADAELREFIDQVASLGGKVDELPRWLHDDRTSDDAHVASRMAALEREDSDARQRLDALHARHALRTALGDASRVQWLTQNVRSLESGDVFCWITGWTSDTDDHRLASALDHSNARAILILPAPPAGTRPPLLLSNPWWVQPFEVFSRALGTPSRDEADPAALLAVVVPLMFGYMFGDVGQGLVIAAAGLGLRNRWPLARLLVAAGLAAAVFGLLFGSVFSLHVHALWIAPLDDPLTMLIVPLYGGAALLAIGIALSATEAYWRGEIRGWLGAEVWLAVAYFGLLLAAIHPFALIVAAGGGLLFCVGRGLAGRAVGAGIAAIAELAEKTLQLLINTLSFARVGAFALAHAGLSSAIVALMDASDSRAAKMIVLVIGNVVILALEGLVVSIQTTRLVLFEFFTRFLAAEGRVFRALPAPPPLLQEI